MADTVTSDKFKLFNC